MEDVRGSPTERERWDADQQYKRDELAVKNRELDIREQESKRARWSNPLVLAILGAALAAFGNAVATYLSGTQQRGLESLKGQSQLIIEMVKARSREDAVANLDFLVQTKLLTDPVISEAVAMYIKPLAKTKGGALLSAITANAANIPLAGVMCQLKHKDGQKAVIAAVNSVLSKEPYLGKLHDLQEDFPSVQFETHLTLANRQISLRHQTTRMGEESVTLLTHLPIGQNNVSNEEWLSLLGFLSEGLLRSMNGGQCGILRR